MSQLSLRVLSYNIHQGITVRRNRLSLTILKEALRSLEPDLVFLQEVAGSSLEKSGDLWPERVAHQLEGLADEMWPHFAYQQNVIFTRHHHGNAILSRYPVTDFIRKDITIGKLKRRGLLHGVIQIEHEGHPVRLHVMNAHLGLFQFERRLQVKELVTYVKSSVQKGDPVLIAGDFNDWRQRVTGEMQKGLRMKEAFHARQKNHARTFPSRFPLLHLDRIYFRHCTLKDARCPKGRKWSVLSDHLPIVAEFTLKTKSRA